MYRSVHPGKVLRWRRIVDKRSGRTIIVAIDHGSFAGPMKGIEKLDKLIIDVAEGGANALLITPGILSRYADVIADTQLGIILRLDTSGTNLFPYKDKRRQYLTTSFHNALRMGSDGVCIMGYTGSSYEPESLALIGKVASMAQNLGLIFMAEMFPQLPGTDNPTSPEVIKLSARVAAELGADLVKTFYTGDSVSFKEIVETSNVPIVILGGPARENDEAVLKDVSDAIKAGAIGVAFGRNIWQRDNPRKFVEALSKIIHDNEELDKVLHFLK
ncbi:class I fructose-bisphosphate aldolase [Infirmifilum sp.]|uniref:class I fructose-bisphosphate aldolase n=1 Tax=Infirmifilum sp. TaxID=2856575 RepID=UPI003D0B25B1